ncbi:MAG: M15 family metallopeptidase [Proteobacteria bacterium]|nr:M15 family metallopeptidase [Pseudomonadota bacterium]
MSEFVFGKQSVALLATVKPELQALARRALSLSEVDFGIVQGNRTLDEQMRLYGQGRDAERCAVMGVPPAYAQPDKQKVTWTLKSNHIGGNAIDVCPWVDGHYEWDNDGKLGLWPKIADAFKRASGTLGTPVYWGGDWTTKKDRPHFSLVKG